MDKAIEAAALIERLESGETGWEIDRAFNELQGWRKLPIGWLTPEGEGVLSAPAWSEHPHVGPLAMAALLKARAALSAIEVD
jgi:hypothetical protein